MVVTAVTSWVAMGPASEVHTVRIDRQFQPWGLTSPLSKTMLKNSNHLATPKFDGYWMPVMTCRIKKLQNEVRMNEVCYTEFYQQMPVPSHSIPSPTTTRRKIL